MRLIYLVAAVSATFFTGCDIEPKKDSERANDHQTELSTEDLEAASVDEDLPTFALLRVKLDGNNQETTDQTEFRVLNSDDDQADIVGQFANANAPTQLGGIDELDRESSTQSWYFTQPGLKESNQQHSSSLQSNQYQQQHSTQGQANCNSVDCGTTTEHQQGTRRAVYPVKRKKVYKHNYVDVYPQEKIDVYPVEHVRIHPVKRQVTVHPIQRKFEYVNPCVSTGCGGARYSGYFPAVQSRGYHQYYGYMNHYDRGGYRYYRFCNPRFWRGLRRSHNY